MVMPSSQEQPTANYDFILSGGQKPRGRLSLPGGSSRTGRIIIFGAGLVLLLVISIMFFSLLSSSSRANTDKLISITQQQQEIIRVSTIGIEKARSSATRNLAVTTELSMVSAQKKMLDLLKKRGHKVGLKQLALKQKASTTSALEEAALNNSFDETFTKLINDELTEYRTSVRATYNTSSSKTEKALLDEAFQGAGTLLASTTPQ